MPVKRGDAKNVVGTFKLLKRDRYATSYAHLVDGQRLGVYKFYHRLHFRNTRPDIPESRMATVPLTEYPKRFVGDLETEEEEKTTKDGRKKYGKKFTRRFKVDRTRKKKE